MAKTNEHRIFDNLSIISFVLLVGEMIAWILFIGLPFSEVAFRQDFLNLIGFMVPATLAFFLVDIYAVSHKISHRGRNWIAFALVLHLLIFVSVGLQFGSSLMDREGSAETIGGAFKFGLLLGVLAPHHLFAIGYTAYILRAKVKTTSAKTQKIVKGFLIFMAVSLVASIVSLVALNQKYDLIWIQGDSMYPTYRDGDVLILEKDPEVRYDEIAVFTLPEEWRSVYLGSNRDAFVKRIVGVPGDHISWDGKEWTVNNRKIPYHGDGECSRDSFSGEIGENEIFVIGDTEEVSVDSRTTFCRGVGFLVNTDQIIRKGTVKAVM